MAKICFHCLNETVSVFGSSRQYLTAFRLHSVTFVVHLQAFLIKRFVYKSVYLSLKCDREANAPYIKECVPLV